MKQAANILILISITFMSNCTGLIELFDDYKQQAGPPVYVSSLTGNDSNAGTMSEPLETIQAAIDHAEGTLAREVYVAGGTYSLSGTVAQMANGVSLYGGYSNDFSVQDHNTYESIITDSRSSGGAISDPVSAVYFDSTINRRTTISGFTINAADAEYSAVIFSDGSYINIEKCKINGSSATTRSYGILSIESDLIISNSLIEGGNSHNNYAIMGYNSHMLILNNTIHGGSGTGGTSSTWAVGIYIDISDTDGSGNPVPDLYYIKIENNIIYTTAGNLRYGVFESFENNSDADVFRNNNIFDCPSVSGTLFSDSLGGIAIQKDNETELNDLDGSIASGNKNTDPLFVNQAGGDWHFTGLSPADVTGGGLNGFDEGWSISSTDFDGNPRPASGNAWSMGAFQN